MPSVLDRRLAALLLGLFAFYLVCGSFGYGNDNDTYAVFKTWSDWVRFGIYYPSRTPGFLLPETLMGLSSQWGGSFAANALSAIMASVALFLFHALAADRFSRDTALLATAAAGLNPHWVIAASSSMDYTYGAGFFLAALWAL